MQQIVDSVMQELDNDRVREIGEQLGLDAHQVRDAVRETVPAISGALEDGGQAGLEGAQGFGGLGGVLGGGDAGGGGDVLGGVLGGLTGGSGGGLEDILGSVLGQRQHDVTGGVARKTGLGQGQSQQLIMMLLPLILSAFQKYQANRAGTAPLPSGPSGGEPMGGAASGGLGSMLDKDGDGKVLDDIAGSVLGGLFGKK